MKKSLLTMILVFCLAATGQAAPSYGTKMPRQKQFFAGLQSYTIFNRQLENDYGKLRSQQEFALLSLGIFDWLALDLKGGAGDIRHKGGRDGDIDYAPYLGGGYGFRLRLYNSEQVKAVFGFQHISIHPYPESIGASKHKAVLDDWQFSLLASYEGFRAFTPYAGTRWSWMNEIHWIDTQRKLERSDLGHSVGLIVGADIPVTSRVWLNVEGQFLDATALAGSINFSF